MFGSGFIFNDLPAIFSFFSLKERFQVAPDHIVQRLLILNLQ